MFFEFSDDCSSDFLDVQVSIEETTQETTRPVLIFCIFVHFCERLNKRGTLNPSEIANNHRPASHSFLCCQPEVSGIVESHKV